MRKLAVFFVLLLLISVQIVIFEGGGFEDGISSYPPTRGSAYINETTSSIAIGNDNIEFVLNKDVNCGISKIIDKSTGLDLRGNKVPPPIMLMIMYWTGNATDIVIQWDAESMDISGICTRDSALLYIYYYNFRGSNLNATVTMTLGDDDEFADFTLDIQNDEDFTIKSVFFPLIWGLGQIGDSAEDDRVFYPGGDGIVLKDPLNYTEQLFMTEMYPSTASMQMFCHYDPNEAGLYMTTNDDKGHPKKPSLDFMEWSTVDHLAGFFEHPMEEYPGNDYDMEFECQIGVFHGDWYDAADIYKSWAETTDFLSGGKVFEEKDTPKWWAKTSVVSSSNRDAEWIHNTLTEIEKMTEEFNELTGVNTTHLIFAWAQNGAWCGPYYFPPAAGEDNFTNSMENITDLGGHPFLYISGSVWRITRGDIGYEDYELFNDIGRQWACIDQYGNPVIDEGYLILNWTSARMCPMTDFWKNMVISNVLGCLNLGVDVVQIDEFPIGSIYACHNTSHGHPPGYSEEITAAYREIINESRRQGRMINSDFIMSMEEPCEFYIPWMDTYVSRDNAPEFMLYPFALEQFGNDVEFVPFFSYVYHEYITAFAEPIPMNYDYPELFINQMRRSLARALVTGEIISGSSDDKENLRPEVREFYNTTVRASAGYCNDYLIKGKMLRPPEIDVPNETVDWFFYSNQTIGSQFEERSVLNSAWKADDGDIGHVFVNWIDQAVEFDVELPAYDLGNEYYSVIATKNEEKEVLFKNTTLPVSINLGTKPGEVVLVEITRAPDLAFAMIDLEVPESGFLTDSMYFGDLLVVNSGNAFAGGVNVVGYIDTTPVWFQGLPIVSINPGHSRLLSFMFDTESLAGEYNLSFIIDPDDEILESNEKNNTIWMTIHVSDRPRAELRIRALDSETGLVLHHGTYTLWAQDRLIGSKTAVYPYSYVVFDNLDAGEYFVNVSVEGYHKDRTSVTLQEGESRLLEVKVNKIIPVYYIYGKVVHNDPNSTAFSGAQVTLRYSENHTQIDFLATGEDGEFSFARLLEGNYTVTASHKDYLKDEVQLELSGDQLVYNVPLKLSLIIPDIWVFFGGKVIDNDTGDSLMGVTVRILPGNRSYISNETGIFGEDWHVWDEGIPSGEYSLFLTMDGYINKTVTVEHDSLNGTWVIVKMEKIPEPEKVLAVITGIVRDEFGETIPHASVTYNGTQFVVTGINGTFIIKDLEPGNYHLNVSAEGYLYNDTLSITVEYDDEKFVEIILEKDVEEPTDTDEFEGRTLIIITVIITMLVLLGIVLFIRWRSTAADEE
jgi:hypothetical protein